MKKLLVLMLAMLTAVTSPEQFKVNYICPRQYRLCFYTDVLPAIEIVPKRPRQQIIEATMQILHRGIFMPACPA